MHSLQIIMEICGFVFSFSFTGAICSTTMHIFDNVKFVYLSFCHLDFCIMSKKKDLVQGMFLIWMYC